MGLRTQLIAHNGSVQDIDDVPSEVKELYKTVWEVKQRAVLDMAADRGAYIDQSQSTNIHMINATTAKLSSMHFHGWSLGLKTGMYYLRTKAATDAIKFTVDVEQVRRASLSSPTAKGSGNAGYPATQTGQMDAAAVEAEQIQKLSKEASSRFECVGCGS